MVGLIVAMLIITFMESLNARLHPFPADMAPEDHLAMQTYISTLPPTAFIIMLAGYLVASLCCGMVIRLIARSADKTPAYLAGIGLMTAGIVNFFSFEHPWWAIVIGLLIFLPATLLGFSLVRKKP